MLLRRRALAKLAGLAGLSHWLFTDEALQQATAVEVARHRARRLAGACVHDATCSVGTELAALRSTASYVVGSDIDEVRLAMARHNLGVDGRDDGGRDDGGAGDGGAEGVRAEVSLCRADALRPVSRDAVVVLDPARRSGGNRRFDPRGYVPPLDQLIDVYQGRRSVVKCAPGIDFEAVRWLGFDGEIEITSYQGSVREACLWSPELSESGVRRRATVLSRGEELTDRDPDECGVGPPGRWIVDPDGAVVRAGLVRHYGARHGLWQLDPNIAYLTGGSLPTGVRGFEVLDELPMREKVLRQVLSGRDCGSLEILVRGVDIDPDVLRRRLRPTGRTPLTVVITRIGAGAMARSVAFICRSSDRA